MTRIANQYLRVSFLLVNGAHLDLCCLLSAKENSYVKICCNHNQDVFL